MSRPHQQKIPVNPPQQGLNSALAHAFGALDPNALPPGPTPAESPRNTPRPGRAVLRRETAGRHGKAVVVVAFDAPPPPAALAELASALRKACGSGGTVKGAEIEIQGEHAAKVRAELERRGFRVAGV